MLRRVCSDSDNIVVSDAHPLRQWTCHFQGVGLAAERVSVGSPVPLTVSIDIQRLSDWFATDGSIHVVEVTREVGGLGAVYVVDDGANASDARVALAVVG